MPKNDWFSTENGVHIPLNKDENKKDACNEFFEEKQEEYFKKWNDAPEIELKESELDKYSDIKELRTAATKYFKENLQGKPIHKDGLGNIRISNKGLDEYMHFSADPDKLKAIPQIPELIKKGKLGEFEKPHKPRKDNIQGFYPIYANLKTKEGTKKAELLIGKDNEGNLFYQMFLDFNRDKAREKTNKKRNHSGDQVRLSLDNSINYLNLFFNPISENCNKMYATDKKEIDHNDYWYIKDNPLSKVGVFPYLGRQISEDLEPDKIYQVLRPEEELSSEETLNSFKLIPIVDDHTMLGTKPGMMRAEEKGVHGVIGEDVYYKDGIIYGDLKIFSESLKEEIENGKKELSMGYFCDYELKNGEYNGEPFQAIQRNLRINHVALVDEGRMGSDVRVMDKKITFDSMDILKDTLTQNEGKKALDTNTKKGENSMLKTQKKSLGKTALDEDIEEITKDECKTQDEDVDKRKLIDEIGGMLKDKVDEELWRTIVGKIEQLAYNDSKEGVNDEDDIKEDDKKTEDEDPVAPAEPAVVETEETVEGETEVTVSNGEAEVTVSMDSMIKEIGQRDALVDAVRPLIGDNTKYKFMSTREVAKYACDKLDLKVSKGQEISVLRGYLAATKKQNKVNYSLDSAVSFAQAKDPAFERYMEGK